MKWWAILIGAMSGAAACWATCCTPAERQDVAAQLLETSTKIAARAAIINLGVFCRPTDTVEVCIDKLIQAGANEIQIHPELVEGGAND